MKCKKCGNTDMNYSEDLEKEGKFPYYCSNCGGKEDDIVDE